MKLCKDAFRKWLEASPKRAIVGEAKVCDTCPISNYIHEAAPDSYNAVYTATYVVDGDVFPLPRWARKFVDKIDKRGRALVTARRALRVLAACA